MYKQYEYKRLHIFTNHPINEEKDEMILTLNKLGTEGWELVSWINGEAVLKREINTTKEKELLHG